MSKQLYGMKGLTHRNLYRFSDEGDKDKKKKEGKEKEGEEKGEDEEGKEKGESLQKRLQKFIDNFW